MNVLRRFAPALLVLPALFADSSSRAEDPAKLQKPTSAYVSDFAGVIDPASKQAIEDLATQVYTKAHATIIVVTVNSLDGQDIETWTTALEDNWKVGPKGSDKGVVLVFAIQDHKRRIEVGYGLEGILPDAKVGDIGRSMVPQLKAGQYGPAILDGVTQIGNVIAADASVALSTSAQQPLPPVYRSQPSRRSHFPWGIVIFVVIFIILSHGHGGGRGGGGGGSGWLWFLAGSMLGGGGGRGGSDFGGGGGGGSSGGGDFGGGFGGGSGGGGASGDW